MLSEAIHVNVPITDVGLIVEEKAIAIKNAFYAQSRLHGPQR